MRTLIMGTIMIVTMPSSCSRPDRLEDLGSDESGDYADDVRRSRGDGRPSAADRRAQGRLRLQADRLTSLLTSMIS
jgi:hypothetical protein